MVGTSPNGILEGFVISAEEVETMKGFFDPRSIAVVGASTSRGGNHLLQNVLRGHRGPVYPVNPNHQEIEGLRCYPKVESIPEEVELAVVFVPAAEVPGVLEDCARKGVKRVMIQSAGFAEVGPEGKELQQRCLDLARSSGIRLWGPNCMGLVDVPRGLYLSFMHPRIHSAGLLPGNVSLVVQSGMLSAGFLADLAARGMMGVAKACSIGNKADLDECDILEYLLEDPQTRAVAMYLESVPRGRRLVELARDSSKPMVVVLGGRSLAGARAAMSHTSSLSGDLFLAERVLEAAGLFCARDFFQMMEVAKALAMLPEVSERCALAVLTFSGGAGILSCDLADSHDIPMGSLCTDTVDRLKRIFPPWMPVSNPVDLYPALEKRGRVRTFMEALEAVVGDPEVDAVLIHHFAGLEEECLDPQEAAALARSRGKALLFWVLGLPEPVRSFQRRALEAGVPVFRELSTATQALGAVRNFWRKRRAMGSP